jgi:hypothetical protein
VEFRKRDRLYVRTIGTYTKSALNSETKLLVITAIEYEKDNDTDKDRVKTVRAQCLLPEDKADPEATSEEIPREKLFALMDKEYTVMYTHEWRNVAGWKQYATCEVVKYDGTDGKSYLSMYIKEDHDSIGDPPRFNKSEI